MDELIERVGSSYGLSVKGVVSMQSSDDNDTYKITADGKVFFGRLSKRRNKDSASINSELAFIKYLKSNDIPVAGVISCKDGGNFAYIGDRLLVIFEWIGGSAGSVSKGKYPLSERAYNAGRVLAALHNASAKYSDECILGRTLTTEMERVIDFRDEILKRYTNGEDFLEAIARLVEFSKGPFAQECIIIHNDFRPQNVLFGLERETENVVTGVVDFDWMCFAPPAKDLALALVEWSFADGDVSADFGSLKAFLRGYVGVIDARYMPVAHDTARWIEYACLSDVATYISDKIADEEKQGVLVDTGQAGELKSYMLSKAGYFRSINLDEIFKGIHR